MASDLVKRSLWGILFVAVILLAFAFADRWIWPVVLVFSIFYFRSAQEIIRLRHLDKKYFYPLAHGTWLISILSISGFVYSVYALIFMAFWILFWHIFLLLKVRKRFADYILSFWYIYIPFFTVMVPFSVYVPLFVLIVLWIYDSAAYLVGSRWGKHKLAPKISPGKSIEGLAGGIAGTWLVLLPAAYFLMQYQGKNPYWQEWGTALNAFTGGSLWALAWMMLAVMLIGTAGDLYESRLKRRAGVKDSGDFIPGHGGILDRLDSFYMVMIALFLGYSVFMFVILLQ